MATTIECTDVGIKPPSRRVDMQVSVPQCLSAVWARDDPNGEDAVLEHVLVAAFGNGPRHPAIEIPSPKRRVTLDRAI
jgi:hypothetical protein